jgi:hypothetical protein
MSKAQPMRMLLELLTGTKLAARLRGAWKHDVEQAMRPLRAELRRLTREVGEIRVALDETAARAARSERTSTQLRLIHELDEQQRDLIDLLPTILNVDCVGAHMRQAIESAPVRSDPFEHVVVEGLLPEALYDLLLTALPPAVFFHDRDPIKQNLAFPMVFGPLLSMRVWNFVDEVIAGHLIRPAVLNKFHEPLQRHYDVIFGPSLRERAGGLPHLTSGGRLMLRRPGYHLSPHRDPKHSMVTCLLYLARPGDSDVYGTQLFRVTGDQEAHYKQTYYPESNGHPCELAAVVPFRPNTMLAFLNARGAHGATIPADAPGDLERYSYQFYVAPKKEALRDLLKTLPRDRRAMWQSRDKVDRSQTGMEESAARGQLTGSRR